MPNGVAVSVCFWFGSVLEVGCFLLLVLAVFYSKQFDLSSFEGSNDILCKRVGIPFISLLILIPLFADKKKFRSIIDIKYFNLFKIMLVEV